MNIVPALTLLLQSTNTGDSQTPKKVGEETLQVEHFRKQSKTRHRTIKEHFIGVCDEVKVLTTSADDKPDQNLHAAG